VPRHPERRKDIEKLAEKYSVSMKFRGSGHQMPDETHDIYVADTIGELGLFYRLAPLACIGRSLSNDGGGGHNPIEAAQLDCAILHGPLVQNLQQIYDGFDEAGAAIYVESEKDLQNRIQKLLADPDGLNALQNRSQSYVQQQAAVIDTIMNKLETMLSALDNSDISPQSQSSHATAQNT
jgi:3-deoxy-D-manno-octulosonic-acid transferase